jgi:ribonucleoside-diphosphate reductase alpha chain
MKVPRHFTADSRHPFDSIEYARRKCVIRNLDGSVVFQMDGIEVPKDWSQLASDILVSKYVRKAGVPGKTGHETSVKQVVGRIARAIRAAGEEAGGYFDAEEDAEIFEQELIFLLLTQRGAFNSPVWFNCGLHREYGIENGGGNWHWDSKRGEVRRLDNDYECPQCSACFIQSVDDDLMSIFELVKSEARIFKFGSGVGTNYSSLRGKQEKISGGGTSSGLMSFLEVFDRAAGATKSGGTTRRAAKMMCLDADHPEIREFVNWKRKEERKVRALIAAGYPADFNGEAYHTVSGQNSNNSVRLTDEFMKVYREGKEWQTRLRTTGEVCETFPAKDLMRDVCESAWECADPGVQFDTTINDWNTCPNSGRIRSSNPCSEFMFLDNSACNLASINLLKYVGDDGSFDTEAFLHTVRILILAQEILVDYSSYPVREIAINSHRFRPLGLGYANLGALLMVYGLPYDSDGGRALAGALTAILTGRAYLVSAEIAATRGPFEEFERNRAPILRVLGKHRAALGGINADLCPAELLDCARRQWDEATAAAERHGCRNAQVTVLAPTGTIGLLMDCDTTGIEPDFGLVKSKKLAGGGHFKIVNQSVPRALRRLAYTDDQVRDIVTYVLGSQNLRASPYVNAATLEEKGFLPDDLRRIEEALPSAFELEHAFSPHVVGAETLRRLGFEAAEHEASGFNLLGELGFSAEEIEEASRVICGSMTIEGAPRVDPEHYAVFDCASKSGPRGERFIQPMGHIRMMAVVQPFLSGAISKTVNLPQTTTVDQIEWLYGTAWELGLKAIALYRDGCKSSQPLTSRKSTRAPGEDGTQGAPRVPEEGQLELFPELAEYGPKRRRLPKRRGGITVESRVAGHKVYLRTGEYEDGNLGEVFIDMHKEGSSFRSMMMCFAIAVSKGLQYGVPLREFVDTFTFTNFEPRGVCDHPNIKMVNSVIDYVFRVLGLEYLGRTDFCQVKPEDVEMDEAETEGPSQQPAPVPIGSSRPSAEPSRSSAQGERDSGGEGPNGNSASRKAQKRSRPPRGPEGKKLSEGARGVNRRPSGSRAPAPTVPAAVSAGAAARTTRSVPAGGRHPHEIMGDTPLCDICGHITVRNGACYKCLNCGNSIGCS